MLVILLLVIATFSVVGGLLIVNKAGAKDGICDYGYIEK